MLADEHTIYEDARPRQGYARGTILDEGITVLYDGMPGMGTHIVVSGGGCDKRNWPQIVESLSGSVARVDIAFDIEGKTAADLKSMDEADQVQTTLRGRAWFVSSTGCTYAFGSRVSDTYVRGYDKRGPLRLEYEFKRKRAKVAWRLYCTGLREIAEYCAAALRVVVGTGRKRERKMAQWFREHVSETSKPTPPAILERTVGDVIQYVARAVGSALVLLESQGVAVAELVNHLTQGKLSLRHRRLLISWYRQRHGSHDFPFCKPLRLPERWATDSRSRGGPIAAPG